MPTYARITEAGNHLPGRQWAKSPSRASTPGGYAPEFLGLGLMAIVLRVVGALDLLVALILFLALLAGIQIVEANSAAIAGAFLSGILFLAFGELLSAVRHIARSIARPYGQ